MSEKDNNVMPLATDPHNLGEFDNVYDAMRRYPNGGVDGDYIYILGVQHFWNVNRQSWGILKDKEDNLVQMVEDFIGLFERRGYVFAGYALPDTTPVSGLDNIFYIAAKNGAYTHFGSDLKLLNEVAILRKPRRSSIWIKDSMDIPNSERIDVIDDAISRINVDIKTIKSAIIGMENDLDGVHDSIDDINKDIDAFKKETSENFEEVNSDLDKVEKRLDYIPKESFLSAHPAGFKPDIDLTPEITVDRAWRDHEGNVIRDTYITRRGLRNEIIDITNQQVTDLKPGSVDPDDLSEATKQLIGNKSITNLPDEEDITITDNQTLKLKDKEYAPKDYSGMGRVYLRKHYVNGVNTLTQHMMKKPNTIYIIQYDYCLAGQTIEVPENCVLDFQGGSLRNGILQGNNTIIKACYNIFDGITFIGSFECSFKALWFNVSSKNIDNSPFIMDMLYRLKGVDKSITLDYGGVVVDFESNSVYRLSSSIDLTGFSLCLDFKGCIFQPNKDFSGDYVIGVFSSSAWNDGFWGGVIKNLNIQNDNRLNVGGIYLIHSFKTSLEGIYTCNMHKSSCYIGENCAELVLRDFNFKFDYSYSNNAPIDVDNMPMYSGLCVRSTDVFISDGFITHYHIGMFVDAGSNMFSRIHIWGYNDKVTDLPPHTCNIGVYLTKYAGVSSYFGVITDDTYPIDNMKSPKDIVNGRLNGGVGFFLNDAYSNLFSGCRGVGNSYQGASNIIKFFYIASDKPEDCNWDNAFVACSKSGNAYTRDVLNYSPDIPEISQNRSSSLALRGKNGWIFNNYFTQNSYQNWYTFNTDAKGVNNDDMDFVLRFVKSGNLIGRLFFSQRPDNNGNLNSSFRILTNNNNGLSIQDKYECIVPEGGNGKLKFGNFSNSHDYNFKYVAGNTIGSVGYSDSEGGLPDDLLEGEYGLLCFDKSRIEYSLWNGYNWVNINGTKVNEKSLKGKKISILGDSISTYDGYLPNGYPAFYNDANLENVNNTYWMRFIKATDATLGVNSSYSGSHVCGNSNDTTGSVCCSTARIDKLGENGDPDIIIINVGINDFGGSTGNKSIGTWNSKSTIPSEGVQSTFSEGYALMLAKIMKKYPMAKIFTCLLIPVSNTGYDQSSANEYPIVNANGDSLYEFNECIKSVSNVLGACIVDMYSCGMNIYNSKIFLIDGLHPKINGHKLMCDSLYKTVHNSFMERKKIFQKDKGEYEII